MTYNLIPLLLLLLVSFCIAEPTVHLSPSLITHHSDPIIVESKYNQPVSHSSSLSPSTSPLTQKQPSIFKLNALCQAYLLKLETHKFTNHHNYALESSKALKHSVRTTLNDLINDCQMINAHTMAHVFDFNVIDFKLGVSGLLRSIQQYIALLDRPERVYMNSKYLNKHFFHDWDNKIHRWKMFMRLMYSKSGQFIPAKLCTWFHRLKSGSENALSIVSDTAFIHILGFNQTDNLIGDYLLEIMSLYNSVDVSLHQMIDTSLIGLKVDSMMDTLTEEYFVGANNIDRLRLMNFHEDSFILTIDWLTSLTGRMRMMVELIAG